MVALRSFRSRLTGLLTFNIISELDYKERMELAKAMPALKHGFFVIVLAGGRFRIIKREHKTRGMQGDKKPDDVDVQGAVLAERYPLLTSLLGELVEARQYAILLRLVEHSILMLYSRAVNTQLLRLVERSILMLHSP